MSNAERRASAANVKALRKHLGLSQTDFAAMLGMTGPGGRKTVYNWETGATMPDGPATLALEALASGWRPAQASAAP